MKKIINKVKQVSIKFYRDMQKNVQKFGEGLGKKGRRHFKNTVFGILLLAVISMSTVVLAAEDPLTVVNNLSDFIFGLIRAVGMIILGFSVVQIGLSIKSHDPSQRANGFLTLARGIVITFSKEILTMITGG